VFRILNSAHSCRIRVQGRHLPLQGLRHHPALLRGPRLDHSAWAVDVAGGYELENRDSRSDALPREVLASTAWPDRRSRRTTWVESGTRPLAAKRWVSTTLSRPL